MSDEDMVEMGNSKNFGFKDLAVLHLRKILNLSCTEFRGGYFTIIRKKDGTELETYVPDTRESFGNAVLIYALMLKPKFNETMLKQFNEFKTKLESIKSEFIKNSSVNEEVVLGEGFYTEIQDKVLLETFKQKKLELHLELFDNLSHQISEDDYLTTIGEDF